MASHDRLVWIDCEMTGLDVSRDQLVEIAVIVTDADLVELDEGVNIIIRPADLSILDGMDDVVRDMHTSSGLLDLIPSGVSLAEAEAEVLAYVQQHVPEARKAPLAGSSVYVDRGFISRDMPSLDAHLHYRLVDVSSIKELARRWYPRSYFASPEKKGNHRALGDIRDSIGELRYYRDAVFVPAPGPDTESARATAAEHAVDPR
ncbi:MAG: oligoribonuclease [Candidatus Nanopelagicales bacterium]|jgi:oligoribonuclease|nr:oligoribonuclease [Candidatus Nanopelagicales bacterium]MDP4715911.1 oligoribonuclease [Candidatus Nanopelagicales bacterium]MDP4906943.1 oligoribonuclease [Candidatus Nanopelagicales bacterium]MDP4974299.1 oligoribonuclease [Candidatus Nanopelagicales bacterium]MDP5095398.1 oligoribonuclease [Candidatus Nanopelagicales bacterium]